MNDPTAGNWAWKPQPEARRLIEELLLVFLDRCPGAARFGECLVAETSTHITDWVGVILTLDTPETRARLETAGYKPRTTDFVDADIHYAFGNPAASTPDILLTESDRMSVGLLVDSVADFFAATMFPGVDQIQGEPFARARWAQAIEGDRAAMWVFERHGYDGFHLNFEIAEHRIAAMHHLERFRARTRTGDQASAFEQLDRAVHAAADELGSEWAADLFMQAEREFFYRNHPAANRQLQRQCALGLGAANTDHVVYAAGSAGFHGATDIFATLGFEQRETFKVGAQDTAHVFEQPISGDTVVIVSGESPSAACAWSRLLGDSLFASGPAGLALRSDSDSLTDSLGVDQSGKATAGLAFPKDRIESGPSDSGIDSSVAQSLRDGDPIGPVVSLIPRRDASRALDTETIAWRVPGSA